MEAKRAMLEARVADGILICDLPEVRLIRVALLNLEEKKLSKKKKELRLQMLDELKSLENNHRRHP